MPDISHLGGVVSEEHCRTSPPAVVAESSAKRAMLFALTMQDWESMNVEDVNDSIFGKTVKELYLNLYGTTQRIGVFLNQIQNQDMIPL